jgi:heptosyltransferase I
VNILIVKLSAIGDVIHTLPSVACLRRRYPDAHITWIIEEAAADLIQNHPHVDRVIVSSRKRWLREIRQGNIRKPFREAKALVDVLQDRTYDLVIDFHGLLKSAVFVFLSRGRRKLGYDSMQELSGLFLNEKIPEDMNKHAVDRYLDFLRYLGVEDPTPEFVIPYDEENKQKIDRLLDTNGIDRQRPLVAVSPVALWDTKLWQEEKFAELADRIVGELKCQVVLTGHDGTALERIGSLMKRPPANLGGMTTLRDLACLYQRASVLVTTDSGPMHLAAAVQTPVVALFGPTDPGRTGPYGTGHKVLTAPLSCRPCFKKTCDTQACMREISVADVFDAVQEKIYGL